MNKILIVLAAVVILLAAGYWYMVSVVKSPETDQGNGGETMISLITSQEAIAIAQQSDCVKEGALSENIFYNPNSKTWWIDLNAEKPGCNPACVVSEETRTAEINWRCTGLIPPEESESKVEIIQQLFAEKYNKNADDVIITIQQEDDSHARGGVQFEPGAPGGIFLVAKVDGEWQLVHDGNGQIPCDLRKYGFPEEMISDCAE